MNKYDTFMMSYNYYDYALSMSRSFIMNFFY